MRILKWASALTLAACGLAASHGARPTDTDVIDVTKNPGCGAADLSSEEKVKRNERLAQYYFQGWTAAEQTRRGHKYGWADYDCFAPTATLRMGYGLKPEPPDEIQITTKPPNVTQASHEPDAMHKAIPNWGTMPGTLRVIPWDHGAYFLMRFGGDTVKGEHIEFWEVDMIAVDDQGKITHWEGYNDTLAVDHLFHVVFGKSLREVGTRDNYWKMLAEMSKHPN